MIAENMLVPHVMISPKSSALCTTIPYASPTVLKRKAMIWHNNKGMPHRPLWWSQRGELSQQLWPRHLVLSGSGRGCFEEFEGKHGLPRV